MGGSRGYDGGKKIKGRKRQLIVDTQGDLLKTKVHSADLHDRAGAEFLLSGLQQLFPDIRLVWADTAYRGLKDSSAAENSGLEAVHTPALVDRRDLDPGLGSEPPMRPSGFQVLARRWVVERTIAWLTTNRRLAKDYERLTETGEMLLYLGIGRILLRRLDSQTRKIIAQQPLIRVGTRY